MEPASSSSFCPACGKPIDALRAGQVAILDGAFRYFCNASCKASYVEVLSKRSSLDAVTATPPHVASGVEEQTASGVRELPPEEEAEEEAEEEEVSNEDEAPSANEEPTDSNEDLAEGDRESPPTLRSPASDPEIPTEETLTTAPASAVKESRPPPEPRAESGGPSFVAIARRHVVTIAPLVGVFVGVLSTVVSLAGEPASAVRLPLALFAAFIALMRIGFSERQAGHPGPLVTGVPIATASLGAIVSLVVGDRHADAHASFVGLAAAGALTVDILIARAQRDVIDARARTRAGLAVTARVVGANATSTEVDATSVKPGQQVLVEASETVPVDGIVEAGEAEVAPWLDSPALVRKSEGDAVVAGAVVVSGRLRVNATFSGNERAWLRLALPTPSRIDLAAPLVELVRRTVWRAAPGAALIVGGAVYADNGSWLDVVIAACGGGYALSMVVAMAAASLAHARGHVTAQRRGIVYKDARAFDAAARADVAVVCSRGTILLGEPEIVAVEAITKDGISPRGWLRSPAPGTPPSELNEVDKVLATAAGAEMSSTHPFAAAILREARARGIRPDAVRSALGHSGLGVTALAANGDRVIVGSRAFLLQEKVSVAIADARTSALEAEGRSVLLVAVGGRLCGLLALQDGLRSGARAAIQRLHDARVEPVLLSGEARDTCETIARALDIEHVRPEILPADRGAEVRALADGGRIVAALGHAMSDDGALGAADVSVAMEAAGSAPGEWAVALASDDVRDAALALTVPRACRDRARTAVVVGGLTHGLGALGIAFGIAPPAITPVMGVLGAIAILSVVRDSAGSE